LDVVAGPQLVGLLRRHPHHQAAAAAGCHRHVAVDEEGQSTEHPLLFDAALGRDEFANAVGEVFVIGHAPTVTLGDDIHSASSLTVHDPTRL
jgi:hypothetical protein